MVRRSLVAFAIVLGGCAGGAYRDKGVPVEPVASVDISRYAGRWYEIARFPNWFEADCVGTTADYTVRTDGAVGVLNACRAGGLDGPVKTISGVARPTDASNARLKVKFSPLMPVGGDYWIVYLDPGYTVAAVGTPGGGSGWILARAPEVAPDAVAPALAALKRSGYDTDRLIWVEQPPG